MTLEQGFISVTFLLEDLNLFYTDPYENALKLKNIKAKNLSTTLIIIAFRNYSEKAKEQGNKIYII